jgi:hypothetical protein
MPSNSVFPPIPAGFKMPFYYASLSVIWVYFPVDPAKVTPFLKNTGLEAALFEGKAAACFDFQRYTAHLAPVLSTVNEVELNVLAYPSVRAAQAPAMSLVDFLGGNEQTKVIGAFRLHVAADNPNAVKAGQELFAEPKFLTTFGYMVPDLNDPEQTAWDVTCNDPNDPKQFIFSLHADVGALDFSPSTMSPVAQYTIDPQGRLLSCTWNLHGVYQSAMVAGASAPSVKFGTSPHPMRVDMQNLLGGSSPAAVQIFESPPVATQSRGFYVLPAGK